MSIPLIDFEKLTSSNQTVSQAEIQALDSACREIGFFYLVNSSLSPALMKKLMAAAQRFFAQPDEVKRAIDIKNSPNHRGYGGIGEEQLDEVSHADWKETFDMA